MNVFAVSIHAPVWVRLEFFPVNGSYHLFQFTHPCGCDLRKLFRRIYNTAFQFTHPCGCDTLAFSYDRLICSFNSRTRVGATVESLLSMNVFAVSIHAPVWVRLEFFPVNGSYHLFQFTHPCGCDLRKLFRRIYNTAFQFTHPCGCDTLAFSYDRLICSFNSRTRVGATTQFFNRDILSGVSIHAPVWVRQGLRRPFPAPEWFQFTHPCGCDMKDISELHIRKVSIHAPVWVRRLIAHGKLSCGVFQFTHPCGCDTICRTRYRGFTSFNSRTRVGATFVKIWDCPCMMFQFTHPCGCDGLTNTV